MFPKKTSFMVRLLHTTPNITFESLCTRRTSLCVREKGRYYLNEPEAAPLQYTESE